MARKTFASIYYFDRELPIHYVQILLDHKNVKDISHYLRISEDDIAEEIIRRLELKKINWEIFGWGKKWTLQ